MDCKFYLCFTRFPISSVFIINRQKMIDWFVNFKKVKINKQGDFILHLKSSSFLVVSRKVKKMRGGQFKTTCLTDNRMNIDVKNGTWKCENIQFMQEWWNDECSLFIYLPSWRMQRKREKILISCVSYSRRIPVLVFLVFCHIFQYCFL